MRAWIFGYESAMSLLFVLAARLMKEQNLRRLGRNDFRKGERVMIRSKAGMAALMILASTTATAYENYQEGRITNVSVVGTSVLVMLDTGMPTNCTGSPNGWMEVTEDKKAMQSLVLGIWMRGTAAAVNVTVYTDARTGGGWCKITQIDPIG